LSNRQPGDDWHGVQIAARRRLLPGGELGAVIAIGETLFSPTLPA